MQRIIFVVGPPCSGKGELGMRLEKRLGFTRLVTSDLLEKHSKASQRTREAGHLVSDDIMIPILSAELESPPMGTLLDSIRSRAQLHWFLRRFKGAMFHTLYLTVSVEEIFRRLARASATSRGARADDGSIRRRLQEYDEYMPELRLHLRGLKYYEEIDADKPLEEVEQQAFAICDEWGLKPVPAFAQA